ncbi:MAG: tetratricopeptide repeat protein, partial [Planctomycetes bacterium]|nr:tetratricopeptide repeat protein [Planctomycetota bacterium]
GGVAGFAFADCLMHGGQTGLDGIVSQPERAVDLLNKVKKPSPREITLKIRAAVQADQKEAARKLLTAADANYQQSPDGQYFQAVLAAAEGDRKSAMEGYLTVLEAEPKHVLALFKLAALYDTEGDDGLAIKTYEKLVALPAPPINALMNLGVLYEDADRPEDAAYCYRRVLSIYPHHPRARLFLKDAEASLDMFYDEDQEVRQDRKNQILKIPVSDFELSVRSRNCLSKMNIVTLGDLVARTEAELLSYKNFGETSLNEIKQILESKGLRLGMRPDDELVPVTSAAPRRQPTAPAFDVDPNDERLRRPVSDLNLSVRARKCVSNLNLKNIGDLCMMTADDLLGQRNFGVTSLKEIIEQLTSMGLSLRTVDK